MRVLTWQVSDSHLVCLVKDLAATRPQTKSNSPDLPQTMGHAHRVARANTLLTPTRTRRAPTYLQVRTRSAAMERVL